jgi:hypothetical protein
VWRKLTEVLRGLGCGFSKFCLNHCKWWTSPTKIRQQ